MDYVGKTGEFFEILEEESYAPSNHEAVEDQLSMLWFKEDNNRLLIDGKEIVFNKDEIVYLTSLHKIDVISSNAYRYLRFNPSFYCIATHDSAVGCKGALFFGSKSIPYLKPNSENLELLEASWAMLRSEMKSQDSLQLEMLQMMLKRLLILSTRIYKSQENYSALDTEQVDIVRDFNFLVEQHFTQKHTVKEYAELLNKSPKTLSNIFGKLSDRSPLQIIQERKLLEGRRLLKYSDKPISEVGYAIGFNDVQTFSRFFKKHQGISPTDFRQN